MVEKQKIAILAPYVGQVNRGAESFVIEITKRLRSRYDITVFSQYSCEQLSDAVVKVPVEKGLLLKLHDRLFNRCAYYRKLVWRCYWLIPDVMFQKKFSRRVYRKYLKNGDFDLLYPNNGIWGMHYAKKVRKARGTPIIYTGHGGVGKGEELVLKCHPDSYICLTTRHKNWAKQFSSDVTLIPNGVEVARFSCHDRHEKKTVLSVGALTAFKRHELTIRALEHLPECNLIILGSGELQQPLQSLAKKLLGSRCTIESVSYDRIQQYYQNADVFALPSSDGEAFGIVYLEAMSANLPVVATDDESRREIVADAGILCNVEDTLAYAEAIDQALNLQWGNKPRRQAEKFDWSEISRQYADLIDGILLGK